MYLSTHGLRSLSLCSQPSRYSEPSACRPYRSSPAMHPHLFLLFAACTAALAFPGRFHPGNFVATPGRVLTKTFTYDSTKDVEDPCNPVTGDPAKCLKSMEDMAPTYHHPATAEHNYAEAELAAAQEVAEVSGADFDYIYQRGAKKYLSSN
ncbi:hypothetical protein BDZ91DRAFT_711794 [Kalaharituber pfeilii]|nr:hypothetical protein BDZ91DRAFT_711794 [Kalaharituber pfeilii]